MMATLADVCTIIMGQAPPGDSYNDRSLGLPLIAGAGDFKGDRLVPLKFTTRPSKTTIAGDIVLSIRASIGAKVWSDGEYCLGRGVAGLRPGPSVCPGFLWHWLTHAERALAAKGRGATFVQVNRGDIGELPIDLPPIQEQRRIAGTLDRADAIRVKRRQALAYLDTLTQAIFHDMFGMDGWTTSLGELADVQIGPFGSLLHKEDYVSGGISVLNPTHIRGGSLEPDPEFSVTEEKASNLLLYRLQAGDIVLGRRGEMGRAGVAEQEHEGMLCGTGSLIVRPNGKADSTFLHAVLTSPRMRGHLERKSLGATLPNLNSGIVKSSPAPDSPLQMQRRFATRVERVNAQRTVMRHALDADNELFASIQSRAFRGEL